MRGTQLSTEVTYLYLQSMENGYYTGKWNVRSLYRAGSLKTVGNETGKYKLNLVAVQEVR